MYPSLLGDVLPYLGIEPQYTESELATMEMDLPNFRGMSLDEAISRLNTSKLSYEVVGNGTSVINQVPDREACISKENGKVILYTSETAPTNRRRTECNRKNGGSRQTKP